MSDTPEPEINLDLHFLPAWARQSAEVNRYAYFEGGRDAGPRGPRDRRREGPPGGGRGHPGGPPRRDSRPGEGRGGGGPRGGPSRGREGGRPGDRGRRPEPREAGPPLPPVQVSFVPEAKGVESLARQIRLTGRAYPVFEIAHLVLSKPDRYQVTFSVPAQSEGGTALELWVCDIDNTLWLSMDEAVGHVFRKHFEMFYQAEKTPTDPPKGTYTFVAQCGMSGVILGPPNYHDYQSKLRKLHAARFAHLPLEAYKARVRIVRDEATVQKWVEDQSFRTEYNCLNVPEALRLTSRDAAEKHFREVHSPTLLRRVDTWTASGTTAQQLPSNTFRQIVRRAWEDQHRFPLRVVTILSQQFAGHGLQFFKVNKTVTHVCVARPHYLDLEQSPVSDGIGRIVQHLQAHEGCSRRDLVEAIVPTPAVKLAPPAPKATEATAPATTESGSEATAAPAPAPTAPEPSPEQTAVIADLHWLIHQGHVIEFANGRLELAKKPKPRPEPRPARVKPPEAAANVRPSSTATATPAAGDEAPPEGQAEEIAEPDSEKSEPAPTAPEVSEQAPEPTPEPPAPESAPAASENADPEPETEEVRRPDPAPPSPTE